MLISSNTPLSISMGKLRLSPYSSSTPLPLLLLFLFLFLFLCPACVLRQWSCQMSLKTLKSLTVEAFLSSLPLTACAHVHDRRWVLQESVLKTFQVGPNSLFTLLKIRVGSGLKRLKNRLQDTYVRDVKLHPNQQILSSIREIQAGHLPSFPYPLEKSIILLYENPGQKPKFDHARQLSSTYPPLQSRLFVAHFVRIEGLVSVCVCVPVYLAQT